MFDDQLNAPPIVEMHEGIYVVRDDLLEGGSKTRFIQSLVRDFPGNEMVYGSSPATGYAQIALARVCSHFNKKCTLFMAKRKLENLHPYQIKALAFGADIRMVEMGMLSVTEKRARDYVAENPKERKLFPIGFGTDEVLHNICTVAQEMRITPNEVWTVGSSGTLTRGLQMAWPQAEFHCVSVGHAMGLKQLGRAKLYKCELEFSRPVNAEDEPPFPSAPTYDAKAWKFIRKYASKNSMFWNVGA